MRYGAPHHQPPPTARVPAALALVDYVFVCEDASVCPPSLLYHGPFKVLAHFGKFFTLQLGTRTDKVSIDCLKLILSPDPVPLQLPR